MSKCSHPAEAQVPLYREDGCTVDGCGACGFSVDRTDGEPKTSKYRTCPFCGDFFVDEIDERGEDVVCQGCGAEAPARVWNHRPHFGPATDAASKEWELTPAETSS